MRKKKGKDRRLRYYVMTASVFAVAVVTQVFVLGRASADSSTDSNVDASQSVRTSNHQPTVASDPDVLEGISIGLNHISNAPTSSIDRWQSSSDTTCSNFRISDTDQIINVTINQTELLGDNAANLNLENTLLIDDIALSAVGSQIDIQ